MKKEIVERIKKIRVLVLDVDGILTNGTINVDSQGNEFKVFNVQDGFGLVFFGKMGYKTAIISARSAPAVISRAKDLKIDKIYQDAYPKTNAYQKLLKQMNVADSQVCFMGDDLPDICVLRKVGFAVTVPNSVAEVKKEAHYITKRAGGDGAVREVVELILKTQGMWKKTLKEIGAC